MPTTDQPPHQRSKPSPNLAGVFDPPLKDGWHSYGRGNVVIRAWKTLEQVVDLEFLHQVLRARGGCIASAHGFERICDL